MTSSLTQPPALGIDAGGTYTDAVLVAGGRVLAQAKALTTPLDLADGIAAALDALRLPAGCHIASVALATTLATNAIVEGRGGRVGLLLLGYDPKALAQFNLIGRLPVAAQASVRGRLDGDGRELEAVDEAEVRAALGKMRGEVDALAVSGYFSVRNPAHEQRVRDLAAEVCPVPVVCGHEMTSRLDAVKRAVTTALNARLLPIIQTLVEALEPVLAARGITAPISMMSGDGRLLSLAEVRRRPVETILSGPAASVVAARATTGLARAVVIDMGGTTSDIAVLRDGRPGVSPDGASVGGWPTAVNAVDVRTCGLGGDSHIQLISERLRIGPRRVTPVCLAATQHPEIVPHLRRLDTRSRVRWDGFPASLADFVVQVRPASGLRLDWQERAVLEALGEGPAPVVDILDRLDSTHIHVQGIDQLEARGIVRRVGLTPTDLLHVRGTFTAWDVEAARLATQTVARQLRLDSDGLCRRVEEQVVDALAVEVMARLLRDVATGAASAATTGWDSYLLQRALDGEDPAADIGCRITLRDPLVGLGAPASAFLPRLAEKLHTTCICPEHAEVGVALGVALGA